MRAFKKLSSLFVLLSLTLISERGLTQTEQEVGNELVILTESEARLLELNSAGDLRILTVTLEANRSYVISAVAQSESGDPEIFLRDVNGNLIDYDDDTSGLDSQIVFSPLETGVYKLFVRHSGAASGPIETGLLRSPLRSIVSLALGDHVSGVLGFQGGLAVYQIHLEAGETYSATSVGQDRLDTMIEILSPNGSTIAQNDDQPLGPSLDPLVFFVADTTGLHRVEVSGYEASLGDFEVAVNNVNESVLTLNQPLNSSISEDALRPLTINLIEGQTYTIELKGSSSMPSGVMMIADPMVELLHIEDFNAYLEFDDSSNGSLDPFETFTAPRSGTYSVVVSDIQDLGDNYSLTISEGETGRTTNL